MQLDGRGDGGGEPPVVVAETVWTEFRARLRAFVARRVANPADVDDIVQFAFLQLHRGLGGIRSGERIHAWLYSTARRAIADYYRSRSRQIEVPSGDAVDLDEWAASGRRARRRGAPGSGPLPRAGSRAARGADQEAILLTEVEGLRLADAARRVRRLAARDEVAGAARAPPAPRGDARLLPHRPRRTRRADRMCRTSTGEHSAVRREALLKEHRTMPDSSGERNKGVIRHLLAEVDRGDLDVVDEFYAARLRGSPPTTCPQPGRRGGRASAGPWPSSVRRSRTLGARHRGPRRGG